MSKPYNVRLNEEQRTLEWDFEAAEGETIDGFRIYLNGNQQWVEDAGCQIPQDCHQNGSCPPAPGPIHLESQPIESSFRMVRSPIPQ